MAERIEYPPELQGEAEERIRQIHRYLRKIVEQLNNNQSMTDENLSEYIASQASAIRNITGTTAGEQKTDVRDLAAELVETMTNMLKELQKAKANTVTVDTFPTEFAKNAKQTPVIPTGSSTGFVIATAIKALQDSMGPDQVIMARLLDVTGETISDEWHSFLYSGIVGTDANDDPIYGLAIGKDVVTWDANGNPQYNPLNAWAEIAEDGSVIGGSDIATAADLARKADKNTTATIQTDADLITASGKYAIEIDTTSQSNFPAALTDGTKIMMEVDGDGTSAFLQRIWAGGIIYTRVRTTSGWDGWYGFSGTAV